jgi:hypothetical protein
MARCVAMVCLFTYLVQSVGSNTWALEYAGCGNEVRRSCWPVALRPMDLVIRPVSTFHPVA